MARKKRRKERKGRDRRVTEGATTGEPLEPPNGGREEEEKEGNGRDHGPPPTKSEARREKIELNWGQIDSSRESLHSIWRLPNRVRLTPFKTFNGPSWKVLKDARVEPS